MMWFVLFVGFFTSAFAQEDVQQEELPACVEEDIASCTDFDLRVGDRVLRERTTNLRREIILVSAETGRPISDVETLRQEVLLRVRRAEIAQLEELQRGIHDELARRNEVAYEQEALQQAADAEARDQEMASFKACLEAATTPDEVNACQAPQEPTPHSSWRDQEGGSIWSTR